MLSFNANTVGEVVNKFPDSMVLKLNRLPGKGKDRLINILAKIKEFRGDAQSLQKTRSLSSAAADASKELKKEREGKKESFSHMLERASGHLNFPQPTRHADCRVCFHVKEVWKEKPIQGSEFFERHLSDYVTGCPQFIAMGMATRARITEQIKLCQRCLRPDVQYTQEHDKQCSALQGKKKTMFNCSQCSWHSWLCKAHKKTSILDPSGELAPVLLELKADLGNVGVAIDSWVEAVPQNLFNK